MRAVPRPAILGSIAVVLFLACVAREDRGTDATNLRDPWAIRAEPGDPTLAAGKEIFASCASCHLADAGGRSDGTIPRLAGQRAEILEWRLRGLQDGSIDLPVMTPFARALTEVEIRQVSAYLASLPRPDRVGVGSDGVNERGAKLYHDRCRSCHSAEADAVAASNAPRLCGQHEAYLLRRLEDMASGNAGGAGAARAVDPAMEAVAIALSMEDRLRVSRYLARSECD